MKKIALLALSTVLWSTVISALPLPAKTKPIRVLILDDGRGSDRRSASRTRMLIVRKELEDAGIFSVSLATPPASEEGLNSFNPQFNGYQAVVVNHDLSKSPAALKLQLDQFVSSGGGLVIVDTTDDVSSDGKLFSDDLTGHCSRSSGLPLPVVTRAARHPIMKGLPPVWMHAAGEFCSSQFRSLGENVTVLATVDSDAEDKGADHDQPILFVANRGKGRVFRTAMGGDISALSYVGFVTTLQRGAEWAATGRVTQRVPADFPTEDSVTVRVDLAEMGPVFMGGPPSPSTFDALADSALESMRRRADELRIGGVAVVAYFEGDTIEGWSSKMAIVGRLKDDPSQTQKGSNLLAIAYSKAAEMADTLKDSGSHIRPPMTGEFGWNGGVIVRGKNGYLIAAFSGGKDQDDVSVSRSGVAQLKTGL